MSYDPDDFDNNPFAQPHHLDQGASESQAPQHPAILSAPAPIIPDLENSQYPSPYGAPSANEFAEDLNKNHFVSTEVDLSSNGSIGILSPNKQNQELPKLPIKDEEQLNNNESTNEEPQFTPDLSLLPERRAKKKYHIRIKLLGVERVAKKDPIINFNAYTNLPNFRATAFKNIRRSYNELERFFEYLNDANPECFVPSLPGSHTSYGAGSTEDEKTLTKQLQYWFDRVVSNPILIRNEEFVFFIENDSGYSPINKGKVPASGLKRKTLKQFQPPYDEVTELVKFRPYIKQVYLTTQEILKSFEKTAKARKNFGLHVTELGNKVSELARMEISHPGMVNLWQKFGKSLIVYGDIEAIKSVYDSALFGDEIKMISGDAYIIKEQLTNRHLLMRDYLNAEQTTKSKHAQALKAKKKRYEDPIKIDQIIKELEDSKKYEDLLKKKISRVSSNMLIEKNEVLTRQDLKLKLILRDYTKKVIENERKILSNFEKIRLDVRMVDEKGGLSRLGRENYPKTSGTLRNSQRYDGDDWSGDRKHQRNSSIISNKEISPNKKESKVKSYEEDDEDITEVFDAKSAATLLGTSTF